MLIISITEIGRTVKFIKKEKRKNGFMIHINILILVYFATVVENKLKDLLLCNIYRINQRQIFKDLYHVNGSQQNSNLTGLVPDPLQN